MEQYEADKRKHDSGNKKMKEQTNPDKNMTVLGSGNIITQLADHNLIDEYLFMI